jgi:hypothetical protein
VTGSAGRHRCDLVRSPGPARPAAPDWSADRPKGRGHVRSTGAGSQIERAVGVSLPASPPSSCPY